MRGCVGGCVGHVSCVGLQNFGVSQKNGVGGVGWTIRVGGVGP